MDKNQVLKPFGYPFPKSARLLTKSQFQSVLRAGKRFIGSGVSIDWRKGFVSKPKLGITVSKRYGKAHDRNRFKRLVREIFRAASPTMSQDLEINVIPRRSGVLCSKEVLEADFKRFLLQIENRQNPNGP
ncbi:ribonuclease P protein component [Candidatus Uhrbacteria bacterium]|nr:ribonuclease P protein component [Candidatus Uhrbacteria bacterium]